MASKTNLIHRHKLIMQRIVGRDDAKGNFKGGQNYHIIRRVYLKQKPVVLAYVRNSTSIKAAIDGLPNFFKREIKPTWLKPLKQVWLNSAEEAEDFVKEHHNPVKKGEEIIQKDYQDYADEWMDQHAGTKIDGIIDTDQEWLANTLRSGVSEGKTQAEIADDLVDDFDNVSDSRARTIATTETHGAYSYASNETAKDLLPDGATKIWWTTSGNPRPSHEEIEGTEIAIDDVFELEDGDLAYPGDPSGPASETINCMCVLEYSTGPSEEESELSPEEEESALGEASMALPEEE